MLLCIHHRCSYWFGRINQKHVWVVSSRWTNTTTTFVISLHDFPRGDIERPQLVSMSGHKKTTNTTQQRNHTHKQTCKTHSNMLSKCFAAVDYTRDAGLFDRFIYIHTHSRIPYMIHPQARFGEHIV